MPNLISSLVNPPNISKTIFRKSKSTKPSVLIHPPNNAKLSFLLPPQKTLITQKAPPSYFAPDKYPELDYISDQQQCGNCWAVGSMNSISDRYSITNNVKNPHFSPLGVITCTFGKDYIIDYKNYKHHPQDYSPIACEGGYPEVACLFSERTGVTPDDGRSEKWLEQAGCNYGGCCVDYNPEQCYNNYLPTCPQFLNNTIKTVKNSTKSLVIVNPNKYIDSSKTIENMKREIYYNGPIIGKYTVYSDFMTYSMGEWADNPWSATKNIYIHSKDNSPYKGGGTVECKMQDGTTIPLPPEECNAGNHVVEIVGYGSDVLDKYGVVDYWIIRNSWGDQWGQQINNSKYRGYCKIAMWAGGPSQNFQLIGINKDIGLDIPFSMNLMTSSSISLYNPIFWDNPTFGGAVSVDVKCENPPCKKDIIPPKPTPTNYITPKPTPPNYITPTPTPKPSKGLPIPVIIGISVGVISTILILILILII